VNILNELQLAQPIAAESYERVRIKLFWDAPLEFATLCVMSCARSAAHTGRVQAARRRSQNDTAWMAVISANRKLLA
jgi:hypothetical protein